MNALVRKYLKKISRVIELWRGFPFYPIAGIYYLFDLVRCPVKNKDVHSYNGFWVGKGSFVTRVNGKTVKRAIWFRPDSGLKHEWEMLSRADSRHFPKVYSFRDSKLEMEDCGVILFQRVPKDWRWQFSEILQDLEKNGILHGDIHPCNLMVKDGVIKLIDFQWAQWEKRGKKKVLPASGCSSEWPCGLGDQCSMKLITEFMEEHLKKSNG